MNDQIPEAPFPTDEATRRVLTEQLQHWWAGLTPGQQMSVYLASEGALPAASA